MKEITEALMRVMTHNDQCWRYHPDCALRLVEALTAERDRLREEVERLRGELSQYDVAIEPIDDDA